MSRKLVAACMAALTLSGAAHAADQQVFVNGMVGIAEARIGDGAGDRNGSDVAAALRVGVVWRGQPYVGVETGYVDLGRYTERYVVNLVDLRDEVRTRAALLGVNATYRFDAPWYLTARGGILRSWLSVTGHTSQGGFAQARASGNGGYLGIGGGYDVTEQLSVGAHLDVYHVAASRNGGSLDGNVATFGLQLEYRY